MSQRARDFAHENFNETTILHGALSIIHGQPLVTRYIPIQKPKRIVVFTDLCINVIDGSSVWMMSLVELLLCDPNIEVVLVTREPCNDRQILSKFDSSGRFYLETFPLKFSEENIDAYIDFLAETIKKHQADKTIVRALPSLANRMPARLGEKLTNNLIYYLIGEAYPDENLLRATSAIYVQTDEALRRFEARFKNWAGVKTYGYCAQWFPIFSAPTSLLPLINYPLPILESSATAICHWKWLIT